MIVQLETIKSFAIDLPLQGVCSCNLCFYSEILLLENKLLEQTPTTAIRKEVLLQWTGSVF